MLLPTPIMALPAALVLPPDLDQPILDELLELWNSFNPRDAFERLLVSRILQAVARLQISALRETDEADPLWLRYESAADRLFRQSLKALETHRLTHPVIATNPTKSTAPPLTPTPPLHPLAAVPTPSPQAAPEQPTPNTKRSTPTPTSPVATPASLPAALSPRHNPTPDRQHLQRDSQTNTTSPTSHSPRSLRSA